MNEEIIEKLLEHLKDGRPLLGKKRKPISDKTYKKYKLYLVKLSEWLNKDFTKLTEEDITTFRKNLYSDKIKSYDGTPLKNSSKRDIEYKTLGLLLKYLNRPELLYYTDRYNEKTETPALNRDEIDKMIAASKIREKVIIAVLFDGGFRADEFLNIRFSDIKDDERKAKGFYKIRITKSKTIARTVGLYLDTTTDILDQWIRLNKDKIGTNDKLVDISYNHFRMNLTRIGESVLKKRVYPHLLRHSSATFYCHKLNRYQLCKRYGWSMASDMPAIYIDREGVEEDNIGENIKSEESEKYKKEVALLREQMRLNEEKRKAEMEEFKQGILKKLMAEIRDKKK